MLGGWPSSGPVRPLGSLIMTKFSFNIDQCYEVVNNKSKKYGSPTTSFLTVTFLYILKSRPRRIRFYFVSLTKW